VILTTTVVVNSFSFKKTTVAIRCYLKHTQFKTR